MMNAPGFQNWEEMQSSGWLRNIRSQMQEGRWPIECHRCESTEPSHSIRLDSINRHKLLEKCQDYLILGGVLDNICNSACQSCNANLSTKIGSLQLRNYPKVDNRSLFDRIPIERVIELDINGGEPTASPNYQSLLENLPPNIKIIRINTNGSRLLPNIENLLDRGIHIIITLSLDGVGRIHDYVRWPISWANYQNTVGKYKLIKDQHNNLTLQAWTTVHALNLRDLDNIKCWASDQGLKHSWAYLDNPRPLNARYKNSMTIPFQHVDPDYIATDNNNQDELDRYIVKQDLLRSISIKDYL